MDDTICLRLLNKADFGFIYELYCEKSQIYWSGHSEAPKKEILFEWFQDLLISRCLGRISYIISNKNMDIGLCRLVIDSNNKNVCSGCPISVSENYRNRGYGTKALSLLISEARTKFDIRYMYDWILDTNEASKRIYTRNGFSKTGNVRDQFIPLEGNSISMYEYILDTSISV